MISVWMTMDSIDDTQKRWIENLYEKYKAWVLKEAYGYVHNYDTAQDILNDTFIKLMRHIDTIQNLEGYQLGGYIKRTIFSVAMNYISKESVEKKKMEEWIRENDMMEDTQLEIEQLIHRTDLQKLLSRCMAKMDSRDRLLLICKYVFNMTYTEISERYPMIPHGNISSYIRRAKRKFKVIMRKELEDE